ncbi:MAG: protein translocase SEC61 complex subunit gamma [Halobacteriota archaeon]
MAKKQRTPSSTPKKQQEAPEEGRFSINTIKRKLREYQRILTLTRRPTREEFSTIAKVAAIGIVIIGAVGFVIYLAMVQAPQNLGITNATHTQQTAPAGTQASTVPSDINNTTGNFTSVFTNSTQISTTGAAT